MRQATTDQSPSLASDLGALAGLYRTVFWMMGRKAQYGRIWPPEAEMGVPTEAAGTTELLVASQGAASMRPRSTPVEVGARD
jgi:hypothetical protein